MTINKKTLEAQLDYLCKELDKIEQTDNSYQQQSVIPEEIDYLKAELIKIEVKEQLKKIQDYQQYKAQSGNL